MYLHQQNPGLLLSVTSITSDGHLKTRATVEITKVRHYDAMGHRYQYRKVHLFVVEELTKLSGIKFCTSKLA